MPQFRNLTQRDILAAGDVWKPHRWSEAYEPIPDEWHGRRKGECVTCKKTIRRPVAAQPAPARDQLRGRRKVRRLFDILPPPKPREPRQYAGFLGVF